VEFLKANGIEADQTIMKDMDYQEVLNSQEIFGDELQMFAKKENQKEVTVLPFPSHVMAAAGSLLLSCADFSFLNVEMCIIWSSGGKKGNRFEQLLPSVFSNGPGLLPP
jgi:hypothetical protein